LFSSFYYIGKSNKKLKLFSTFPQVPIKFSRKKCLWNLNRVVQKLITPRPFYTLFLSSTSRKCMWIYNFLTRKESFSVFQTSIVLENQKKSSAFFNIFPDSHQIFSKKQNIENCFRSDSFRHFLWALPVTKVCMDIQLFEISFFKLLLCWKSKRKAVKLFSTFSQVPMKFSRKKMSLKPHTVLSRNTFAPTFLYTIFELYR